MLTLKDQYLKGEEIVKEGGFNDRDKAIAVLVMVKTATTAIELLNKEKLISEETYKRIKKEIEEDLEAYVGEDWG